MFIPKDAFVSNFSMTIKEKIYVANVETKEKAKIIFENGNSNAGQNHKQSDFKETEHVRLYDKNQKLYLVEIKRWVFQNFRLLSQPKRTPMMKLCFK